MITLEAAGTFLADHLLGSIFSAASETDRAAAFAMAECDISAAVGRELDDNDRFAVAAVSDQLVWLLQRGASAALADTEALASESIDGLGSRSYRGNCDRAIAPRARKFVALLRGGTRLEIGRG